MQYALHMCTCVHAHTFTAHATHTPKAAPATRRSRAGMPSEPAPADSMGLAVGDTSKGQTLAADAAQTPTPGMMHSAHQDNSASKGQTLAAEAAGDNRHGQQQGGVDTQRNCLLSLQVVILADPKACQRPAEAAAVTHAGPVTPENEPRLVRSPLGARARRGCGERAVQELTPEAARRLKASPGKKSPAKDAGRSS